MFRRRILTALISEFSTGARGFAAEAKAGSGKTGTGKKASIEVGKDGMIYMRSKDAEAWKKAAEAARAADPKNVKWYKTPWTMGVFFAIGGLGVATWLIWDTMQEYEKLRSKGVISFQPIEGVISNWSATHETDTWLFQPESEDDLLDLVSEAHTANQKIRPVGSALSPNGLSFSKKGMLSMALLDKIINVDPEARQVTVQAGARVQQVVEALRPHGLTLQNFASIREQQIGGYTQVSAHGTGATIPPVDMQVVKLKLVTPSSGVQELSKEDGELFEMAKVGLGALGVVSEVTLQCVPNRRVLERTQVLSRREVVAQHERLLRENLHVKYLWIPYSDSVVVVTVNPTDSERLPRHKQVAEYDRVRALRDLYLSVKPQDKKLVQGDSFTQLRDRLLALNPLDAAWIRRVNAAEAEYWKKAQGYRVGWSDEILGFDCGGQQWVMEVAFPTGTLERPTGEDMRYMAELLDLIEAESIAAPAPIEQRWTASSSSPMSPAYSPDPATVHSWVGVIMYLPLEDNEARAKVTKAFEAYSKRCRDVLMPKYNAATHWAKLEIPETFGEKVKLKEALRQRFPVEKFNQLRKKYDPKGILANDWLVGAFGTATAD